jgi:hypothetical protein
MLIAKTDMMQILANFPEQISLYDLERWLESLKNKQTTKINQKPALFTIGKASQRLSPTSFDDPFAPSIYSGQPLSLEEMQLAIAKEAEKHKW